MRDGASGRLERTVDGLPWAESMRVLDAVRRIVAESAANLTRGNSIYPARGGC